MSDPNLTQTLQNLNQNFPGATSSSVPAPTQPIATEIAGLLRNPLAVGDKLATEATQAVIRAQEIEAETKGGAPNTTNRRLLTEAELKSAILTTALPMLNGFTVARIECRVAENDVSVLLENLVGTGAPMGGVKICDLPVGSEFTYGFSATGPSANKIVVHTSGSALYLATVGTMVAPNLISLTAKRT